MVVSILAVSDKDVSNVLAIEEDHFRDGKDIRIEPAKLTKTIAAFANADGGELYIGLSEGHGGWTWAGFPNPESANGHLQAFERLFPLGTDYRYEFLKSTSHQGLVLRASILKTRDVKIASDSKVYVRRGAQNLPVQTQEQLDNLKRAKGLISHEDATLNADISVIVQSAISLAFIG